jgi:hypothetical protein
MKFVEVGVIVAWRLACRQTIRSKHEMTAAVVVVLGQMHIGTILIASNPVVIEPLV